MKVLVLAPPARYERFRPELAARDAAELVFADRNGTEEEWLAAGADAEALFVTPVTWITDRLLGQMPRLKMVHCEGVGVDRIDLEAARRRGIYVCNNAGCNAGAVGELTVMLMSMLLHRTLWGCRMMGEGRQKEALQVLEAEIPPDLSVSSVGLVGFGAIAQAAARRLRVSGSQIFYYAPHRRDEETEATFGVTYLPLEELAARCDIVSLHLPATPESEGLVDRAFLQRMRPGAFLVNTSRGVIVDDGALCEAIRSGHLAGAAVDAYDREPAGPDHPLVQLAREFPDRVILCPHQGGITQSAFRRVQQMLFRDLGLLMEGKRPENVVNGL